MPCKFFRQGACQAGNACPFSHDLGAAAENVCKYFAKVSHVLPFRTVLGLEASDLTKQGNCKFGPKCANIHVLPDGRRINYSKNGLTIGAAPIALTRVSAAQPTTYHPTSSALTNSFLRAGNVPPYSSTYQYSSSSTGGNDGKFHQLGRQPSLENGLVPTIDTPYSHPNSAYGSPREDERLGLGLSPVNPKGLSVLDAPLPASFDSNGISHAARYGPWPSSMPSKFGIDSPSPSLNTSKDVRTSDTLKLLHTSAFGSSEHLNAMASPSPAGGAPGSSAAAGVASGPGSSPPTAAQMPQPTEEYFGKRAMHSSTRLFMAKQSKMALSSSLPQQRGGIDRDWDSAFPFLEEADYVPDNLKDLLTPSERARRDSRVGPENGVTNGADGGAIVSGPSEIPVNNSGNPAITKFGSPLPTASPGSRWGSLFQRQKEDEPTDPSTSRRPSAFGHVGSPLRNASLVMGVGADLAAAASSAGGRRPSTGNRSSSENLSVLTQQLQRTRLAEDGLGSGSGGVGSPAAGNSPMLHPRRERGSVERHVSTGSIGSAAAGGRFSTPIEEEDPAFVFSMDEVENTDAQMRPSPSTTMLRKRGSMGWTYASSLATAAKSTATAATSNIQAVAKDREPAAIT